MGVRNMSRTRERLVQVARSLPGDLIQGLQTEMMSAGIRGVVPASPRDTGRLQQSWDATVGSPSDYLPPEGSSFPDASAVIQANAAKIAAAPPFVHLYLTSNLPYAAVWNNGGFRPPNPGPSKRKKTRGLTLVRGGWHTAAPQGMLRVGLHNMLASARVYRHRARSRGRL